MSKNYHIISKDSDLDAAIKHIEDYSFLAFDTETTGLNVRKDTVIGLSFSGKENEAYYISRFSWNCEKEQLEQMVSEEAFLEVVKLLSKKELLMWNASFDCRMMKSNFKIDFVSALAADVMLMKHTVQEDGFFQLKRTAIELQEYLGMDMEHEANKEQIELKENVKKNGGLTTKACYEMFKADLDIMGKYAAADADLTLKIANYYLPILEEEGLSEFFFEIEVMPLYKEVTIKMEEMGLTLDLESIQQAKINIQKDIEYLENKVLTDICGTKEFYRWESDKCTTLYPAKKTGKFGQRFVEVVKLDLPKTESGKYSMGKKILEAADNEFSRALLDNDFSGIDQDIIERVQKELFLDDESNQFNISSKKQMGEVVFNYFKIKPLSKTKGGSPQFDDNFIEYLGSLDDIEWAKDLSNYNKLIKIRGTYIDRFLDSHEDGIYYPSFKQHGTISGRYGSDLQQLPRPKEEGELDNIVLKYNNIIRGFFTSGEGRAFIDDDYESLEPHVFAHVSNDDGLRDIFRKGHDFYSTIAIATEKLEGVSADKKADDYLGKVNKQFRQAAKAYCLGIPYGMSAFALGKTLGISTEEAAILVEGYLSGFPNLRKWMEETDSFVKSNGYIKSEIGRIRHLPKVRTLYSKHGDELLNWKYRNTLIRKHTPRLGKIDAEKRVNMAYKDYKNGINNAKNFQIQSLGASIVNLSAIAINRELSSREIDGWVALQIHDQLVINVPKNRAEECQKLVQEIMENTYELSIKLKAPAEIGYNLLEAH